MNADKKKSLIKGILTALGLGLVVALLSTYEITECSGKSMYPTLEDGNLLLVNMNATPKDGDIVIIDTADMEGWNNSATQIVKRYYAEHSTDGLYVMGDNAEMSYDSRDVGEFDKERLLGVVACNLSKDNVIEIVKAVITGFLDKR